MSTVGLGRLLAGVTLINVGQFDCLIRHGLDLTRQFFDLSPVLLVGRRNVQRQQLAQGIHRHRHFAAPFRLAPS